MTHPAEAAAQLEARLDAVSSSRFRGQVRVAAPAERLLDVMRLLKDELGFDFLIDITCVDYLDYRDATDRFRLVYVVGCGETGERLIVRVALSEPDPEVDSLTALWASANWLEREVWDMFGVRFAGHPDLRRILLPEQFTAHPLRKDYPLQGRGERHNFPVLTRDED